MTSARPVNVESQLNLEIERGKFSKGDNALIDQIDWEKAEVQKKIKSIDSIEGIFYKSDAIKAQKNFSIKSKSWRKADVMFSHKKHVVWNGCAVCHPLIFPSSKKGTVQYSMFNIMDGEYCGACHVSVAFSVWLCYKCHEDSVQ